jgi:hypothetical protein
VQVSVARVSPNVKRLSPTVNHAPLERPNLHLQIAPDFSTFFDLQLS